VDAAEAEQQAEQQAEQRAEQQAKQQAEQQAEQRAKQQAEQQAKVVATPQAVDNGGQVSVNGDSSAAAAQDPKAVAVEERVMRYKFILESLGFSLEEVAISPDWDYQVELTFKGRLNATLEILEELEAKFKDEQKLMGMLRTIYDYNNRDLTNFGAYKVVLRLAEPVQVQMYYRKF